MNLLNHVIIINGIDKTYQVEHIQLDGYRYAIKFNNSEKLYLYSIDNVVWLTNPISINFNNCHIFVNGREERSIKAVSFFSHNTTKFYAITYTSGFVKHYSEVEVDIRQSCLVGRATNVFDYLRCCAQINDLGRNKEDAYSESILSSIYSGIDFIDNTTAAAVYLNPSQTLQKYHVETPLFPFGCNQSQQRAVRIALSNQISVIQGPPGTGKTQTILNIVANLLKDRKTVLIVSNNNSATKNVLEKLSANGLGFLVAPLGNKLNKETFVANQPPLNPELPLWCKTTMDINHSNCEVKTSLDKLEGILKAQELLAMSRQELAEVDVEMSHYKREHHSELSYRMVKTTSSKILKILNRLKVYASEHEADNADLMIRLKQFVEKFNLRFLLRFSFGIKEEITDVSTPRIISSIHWLFYIRRNLELKSQIESLENILAQNDATSLIKTLTSNSMTILKASIAKRYKTGRPVITSVKDLFNNGETVLTGYPIVLSTTFSAKACFDSNTIFDYVIMDEASQVSVETGLLALSCAKNAVIVGDTMQLPNVVTEDDRVRLEEIRRSYGIDDSYNAATHSFLSSVLASIPNVPETLLREHYRCHPDIINFCNQKFYGGNLLIMTKRNDDEKHLLSLTTAPGQHCRGHYNQREIDAVKNELMPLLANSDEIGIIAPYNSQVDQFRSQLSNVEAATVHKYQGREKDTIVMSVTDDIITDFADNANLLNVAVSRAKNKFCLVVTGNPQDLKGNIHDLLNYIKYQQGAIIQSKLHSIFDYLFSKIEEHNHNGNSISEYESENLTFDLIESIRKKYPHLSHIKVLCHYPVRYIINDTKGLSDREVEYAMHPATHIDFLVINRVTKEPLLAIETDGYSFHNEHTEQFHRDRMKDKILENYGLPLLRLSTVGYGEEQKIVDKLNGILIPNRME